MFSTQAIAAVIKSSNRGLTGVQLILLNAFITLLPVIPLVYDVLITLMMINFLPPLCSFTTFTMSDCLVLDDMHYDRNFAVFISFCIFCSMLVIYRHKSNRNELKFVCIHLFSTLSFILSLIFVKFEGSWHYHRIFSYLAFISLLIYEVIHSVLYFKEFKNEKTQKLHKCQLLFCLYFIISNLISIFCGIIFALSLDRLYIVEWISFFSVIWYFGLYGISIILRQKEESNVDDVTLANTTELYTPKIEMESLLMFNETNH